MSSSKWDTIYVYGSMLNHQKSLDPVAIQIPTWPFWQHPREIHFPGTKIGSSSTRDGWHSLRHVFWVSSSTPTVFGFIFCQVNVLIVVDSSPQLIMIYPIIWFSTFFLREVPMQFVLHFFGQGNHIEKHNFLTILPKLLDFVGDIPRESSDFSILLVDYFDVYPTKTVVGR